MMTSPPDDTREAYRRDAEAESVATSGIAAAILDFVAVRCEHLIETDGLGIDSQIEDALIRLADSSEDAATRIGISWEKRFGLWPEFDIPDEVRDRVNTAASRREFLDALMYAIAEARRLDDSGMSAGDTVINPGDARHLEAAEKAAADLVAAYEMSR